MNKKKEKFQWQKVILIVLFFVFTFILGILLGEYANSIVDKEAVTSNSIFNFMIIIVCMYIAMFLQVIIHEGGHLIGGLLTGYKFSSFRIFNFMWVKENDKLRLKNLSLVGTGGQCLMAPPELINGKMPYKLYNFGGSMLNIITAFIFLGLYMLLPNIKILSVFLFILSIVGIIFAIMNGVPMRLGTIDNDGYNALSLGKNSSALKSFWMQMKVNELASKGVRLKDMPENLFLIPRDEEMKNSMNAARGVFVCNRLIDEHKFEEAHKLINRFLEIDTSMAGIHRNLMICDKVYCKIISGDSKEEIDSLLDKKQKKFMKSMKKFPTVLRTEYAYELLINNDVEKADKIKKEFNKISLTYPYKSDIESESELIEIAERIVNNIDKGVS